VNDLAHALKIGRAHPITEHMLIASGRSIQGSLGFGRGWSRGRGWLWGAPPRGHGRCGPGSQLVEATL